MTFRILPLIAALSLALPAAAFAQRVFYKQTFELPVRAIDANTFEVVEADGAGGAQIWCAAGKFTREELGQRGGDLTVVQARGPSEVFAGRKSVIFSTVPAADPVTSYSASIRKPGLSFSMAHAYAMCKSHPDYAIKYRLVTP